MRAYVRKEISVSPIDVWESLKSNLKGIKKIEKWLFWMKFENLFGYDCLDMLREGRKKYDWLDFDA